MANRLKRLTVNEISLVDKPANAENGIPRARVALFKRDDLVARVVKALYLPLPGNATGKPKARTFDEVYAELEAMEEFQEMGEEFQEKVNALCQATWTVLADESVADKQERINAVVDQFVASVKQGLTEADEPYHKMAEGVWDASNPLCLAVDGGGGPEGVCKAGAC